MNFIKDYTAAGIPRSLRTMKMTLSDAIEQKLPFLNLPVLVLVGDRDPIVPVEWAQEVVRLLPQGKLVIIPGAAHIINWSSPQRFVEAVAEFLGIMKNERGGEP